MASVCISNCVDDSSPTPGRTTYINHHRWPESDVEFVRLVRSKSSPGVHDQPPKVVDSISCRQMYLRSYTFSRKESVPEKARKCLGRVVGRRVVFQRRRKTTKLERRKKSKCLVLTRGQNVSCAPLLAIFRRFLFCTAKLDMAG
ncbi:hypothetical protein FEM48_Zijuj02G0084600 [Ziziphus jujuba var. spinosa]|uniref:Uncharacterized protein n=1 Tax=Ziziphus jujuba var. spinosa TaxID=714518 RepID=A0A978VUP1_ZIZJJ|nr:hypothetical protein FEM48_Zijuj02G0084600 [Ziziphus jujuba var. spinosa]